MGKYREEISKSNLTNRLSGFSKSFRENGNKKDRTDESRLGRFKTYKTSGRFDSRIDARQKLDSFKANRFSSNKFNKNIDARDILKQQSKVFSSISKSKNETKDYFYSDNRQSNDSKFRYKNERNNLEEDHNLKIDENETNNLIKSRKEPLVIVTGLGNIKKNGDSFKTLKKFIDPSKLSENNDHFVISNGSNTLITLNNDNYVNSESKNNSSKKDDELKISKNYEPIKIKITNSNYVPSTTKSTTNMFDECLVDADLTQNLHRQQNTIGLSKNLTVKENSHKYYPKDEESMDYDNYDYENRYSQRVSPSSSYTTPNLNSSNGYNSLNSTKPSGLIVNNYTTGGLYSSNYDSYTNVNSN
jgi:hypothetical protein